MTAQELAANPPEDVRSLARLWSWSWNFSPGRGPATLFLDLIGWTPAHFGGTAYSLDSAVLGSVEHDMLSDALREYTTHPDAVLRFVDDLLDAGV